MPKIPASTLKSMDVFAVNKEIFITLVSIPAYSLFLGLGIPCGGIKKLAPADMLDDLKHLPPTLMGFI